MAIKVSPLINQSPLLTEHFEKVLKLEAELMLKEGFTSDMILDSHIQLLALAIVAAAQYNGTLSENLFHYTGQKIADVIQEELKIGPPSMETVQRVAEQNEDVQKVIDKSRERQEANKEFNVLVFPPNKDTIN